MYVIYYDVCAFVISEATVSFESTKYEVEEGVGHVELTLALSQAVPFNTSLEIQTIDDTTTTTAGELCSVNSYSSILNQVSIKL